MRARHVGALAAAGAVAGLVIGGGGQAGAQGVTLTPAQLQINQRIAQAVIRRADAVEAHLDGRPITAPLRPPGGARFTVSLAQLRINHRIALAALRRVDRLTARADGVAAPPPPSAGPRVTLSAAQMRRTQRVTQTAVRRVNALIGRLGITVPPPRSRPAPRPSRPTVIAPPRVRIGDRVTIRLEAFPLPPGTRVGVFAADAAGGSGGAGVRLGRVVFDGSGSARLTVRWPARYQFCGGASSCSSVPAPTGPTSVFASSSSPQVSVSTRTTVMR